MCIIAAPQGNRNLVAKSLSKSNRFSENRCYFTSLWNKHSSVEKLFLWVPSYSFVTVVVLIYQEGFWFCNVLLESHQMVYFNYYNETRAFQAGECISLVFRYYCSVRATLFQV